ncbi:hypothetical protein P3W45_000810 [Vairimorpha bombi]|jgi:predicted subunit of tRNA(5-methylaminomethyl-2-thiouridylate) methyltransferase
MEIVEHDTTTRVKNIIHSEEVELSKDEEEHLSDDGKRMCSGGDKSPIANLDSIQNIESLKNNVIKNLDDINRKAEDKHLSAISAITSGGIKVSKKEAKLYQVNIDGWISVKHTFKPKNTSS